jgi:hypothetical protein
LYIRPKERLQHFRLFFLIFGVYVVKRAHLSLPSLPTKEGHHGKTYRPCSSNSIHNNAIYRICPGRTRQASQPSSPPAPFPTPYYHNQYKNNVLEGVVLGAGTLIFEKITHHPALQSPWAQRTFLFPFLWLFTQVYIRLFSIMREFSLGGSTAIDHITQNPKS